MGNLITKVTTNNMELNESNVSDITICDVVKAKSPSSSTESQQKSSGIFKNLLNFDPRSPSAFINRTPIAIFRNSSKSKFVHQELNESIETQVDLEILTPEEEESLGSNIDLFSDDSKNIDLLLNDPRSPIVEIERTPIVVDHQPTMKMKKEDQLVRKLAEKLISTNICDDIIDENKEDFVEEIKPTKSKKSNKNNKNNFIFADDENNCDRFSTPPAKSNKNIVTGEGRTPLSSLNNSIKPKTRIPTSTPKSKVQLKTENGQKSASKIPRTSARRLH